MTHSIYCDSGRQPCPTPRSCGEGCNFNCCTSTKLFTDNSDSSNPGYDYTFMPDWLDLGIAWMQRWAKHIGIACAVITILIFAGVKL